MENNSSILGVRLSGEEKRVVSEAAMSEQQEGDRGGLAAWARRALLREARRVLAQREKGGRG